MSNTDRQSGSQKVKKSLWDSNWEPKKIGPPAPTNHSFSTRTSNKSDHRPTLSWDFVLEIFQYDETSLCQTPFYLLEHIKWGGRGKQGRRCLTVSVLWKTKEVKLHEMNVSDTLFISTEMNVYSLTVSHLMRSPHRVSNVGDWRSLTTNTNRLSTQTTAFK